MTAQWQRSRVATSRIVFATQGSASSPPDFIRLRFTIPLLNPASLTRHVRNTEVIHILGYWNLLSVTTAWLAWWYDRPYVLSAAGEFAKLERPRSVDVAFHGLFGRRMIRHASALVAITELEKTQIVERLGVPDNRVMVVPNGVDEEGTCRTPYCTS